MIRSGQDGLLDIDGDGAIDIAVVVEARESNQAELLGLVLSGPTGSLLATLRNTVPVAPVDGPLDLRVSPDLTGDGTPDFWVVVPNPGGEGAALALVSGAAVLTDSPEQVVALLPGASAQGGASGYTSDLLATGLDATGDGVTDLLALTDGAVRLYSGAAVAAGQTTPHRMFTSPDAADGGSFNTSRSQITFLPDVTGDGRADIAIGDDGVFLPGSFRNGRVYVFSGSTGALVRTFSGAGTTAFAKFGIVAIGGDAGPGAGSDLDGDGVPEVVVSGLNDRGEIYVFSGATGAELAYYISADPCESVGYNLRAVPDTDGDGAADLAYAVRRGCPGEPRGLNALVVASSATGAELFRIEDPQTIPNEGEGPGSGFGEHLLASLGDADGDGLWDLVVSAPNAGGVDFVQGPGLIYAFTRAPVAADPSAEAERLGLTASPNPSRSGMTLSYELPSAQRVRLSIVDVLGREVAVLADGACAAGPHRVATPRLAPGVYVARLVADGVVASRVLSVVR